MFVQTLFLFLRTPPVIWGPNPPPRCTPRCHEDPEMPETTKVELFRPKSVRRTQYAYIFVSDDKRTPTEALRKRWLWCVGLYKRLSRQPHLSCSFVCAMQSAVFMSRPWRWYFHARSAVCFSTPHQGQIYFTKADLHLSSDVEESPVLCQNHAAWE